MGELDAGGTLIDVAAVSVPAAVRYLTDDRAIPTGTEPVDDTHEANWGITPA